MPTDYRADGSNIIYADGLSIGTDASTSVSSWRMATKTSAAFTGGTTNAHGDFDGTGNPYALFTVTGVVEVSIIGLCTVSLVGATATLEVGVAGSTAALIPQSTATNITANLFWADTAPTIASESFPASKLIRLSIIETAGTANITAGAITYYCLWRPVSSTGLVVAA